MLGSIVGCSDGRLRINGSLWKSMANRNRDKCAEGGASSWLCLLTLRTEGHQRSVFVRAHHALVKVDDRTRHQAGSFGEENRGKLRDLGWFHESAERLLPLLLFPPVISGRVKFLLHHVFGGTIH